PQRGLEQLKVPVVPTRELGLQRHDRSEVALDCRRTRPRQLEEIGVALLRHDACPSGPLRRKHQPAELVGGEEDDIGGELRAFMRGSRTPEEYLSFELTSAVLGGGDDLVDAAKPQRTSRRLAIERQGHAVSRRTSQRRSVESMPEARHAVRRVEKSLGVTGGPEAARR